jgi:hypothetical protein
MGQISGIVFIFAMNAGRSPSSGAMTPSLVGLAVLSVASAILAAFLPESPVHETDGV